MTTNPIRPTTFNMKLDWMGSSSSKLKHEDRQILPGNNALICLSFQHIRKANKQKISVTWKMWIRNQLQCPQVWNEWKMNNWSLGTRLKLRGEITKKTNHSTSDIPGKKGGSSACRRAEWKISITNGSLDCTNAKYCTQKSNLEICITKHARETCFSAFSSHSAVQMPFEFPVLAEWLTVSVV
jgi:hypothetical protein